MVSHKPITTPADQLEDHSPIGFSGWDRHSACHGSVALATLCPKPKSSAAADEGTLAHAVAAEWLIRGSVPKGADTVMENFLRPYIRFIVSKLPKVVNGAIWLVEGRVAAPSIHKDTRGTVDSMIWDEANKVLQIHDLKYGKYPVSAANNVQLMGYAICAIEAWKLKPKRIELYIHQVRIDPEPDMWVCDLMDLELFEDQIRDDVTEIERQKAILKKTKDPKKLTLVAGDHCRYCPAWSMCHERKAAADRQGIDLLIPKPDALPANAAEVVAFAKKALPWAKMVLKNAMRHLRQGGTIPGVFLAKGKRARVPKDPKTFIEALIGDGIEDGLGLSEDAIMVTKPPTLKSVAQLEAIVPKDKKKAFNELWEYQPGAPKLALDGEKGEPYKVRPEDYFEAIGEDPDDGDEDEF